VTNKIYQKFEYFVRIAPDNLCLFVEGKSYTYKTFSDLVDSCEKIIYKDWKIGGARILLPAVKHPLIYACIFAIIKRGGTYSPQSTELGDSAKEHINEIFNPDIVIDLAGDSISVKYNFSINPNNRYNNLAYVIFTSGSTGSPKGVMITYESFLKFIENGISLLSIQASDRVSQHPSLSFDLSIVDFFGALLSGASLHVAVSRLDKITPANFIYKHQISIWNSVPSVINLMMKEVLISDININSLRVINFCGEQLLESQLKWLFDNAPDLTCFNTYGPTEATVSMTFLELNRANYLDYCWGGVCSIGLPIKEMHFGKMDNSVFHSWDSIPGSVVFEGVICGPQVFSGYLPTDLASNKKMKKSVLINDDCSQSCFITGDLFIKESSLLFFLKRKDTQIKIKGYRFELSEVESIAINLDIGQVVAVLFNEKIHVLIDELFKENKQEISNKISSELPRYVLPIQVVFINKFPLNLNDKIDRKECLKIIEKYEKYEK
jgi:D-alanine--poly(phosphoribitol) ligase subunit 1